MIPLCVMRHLWVSLARPAGRRFTSFLHLPPALLVAEGVRLDVLSCALRKEKYGISITPPFFNIFESYRPWWVGGSYPCPVIPPPTQLLVGTT